MKKIRFLLKFIGTRNWYQGVDHPTLWEWMYKWRLYYSTACELYKILNEETKDRSGGTERAD